MANLTSLVLDSIDEFNRVQDLQELLKISIKLDPEQSTFLVAAYLQLSEPHFEQCSLNLDRVKVLVNGEHLFDESDSDKTS